MSPPTYSSAFIICHVLAAAYIAEQGNQTSETEREDTTKPVSDEPDEESMFRRTSSTESNFCPLGV